MARKAISKKLRFEVFKRDSFTCQYCGRRAPDVILHCDHVKPVAAEGPTTILNLITSCVDCNLGKGPRQLSDQSTLVKQQDQLAELQSRREQIEMMIDWRSGLEKMKHEAVDDVADAWGTATGGANRLTSSGKDKLRKLVKEFGIDLVLRAIPEAIDTYGKRGMDQVYTQDSLTTAFTKLAGVTRVLRDSDAKPWLRKAFYIRGILRARLHYVDEQLIMGLLDRAGELRADFDWIERFARKVNNWTNFRTAIDNYIREHGGDAK